MGRIEKALEQAKSMQSKSDSTTKRNAYTSKQAKFANRVNGQTSSTGSVPVFSKLLNSATSYYLDPEVLAANRITTDEQTLSVRAAYKMLRTRLLKRMRANDWRSVAISSARSGAGKTVTAINAAISIAHEPNQKAILVDLDLRRPSIAKYLGIEPKHDLVDFLVNDVPIERVVAKSDIDRLLVLPTTQAQEHSSELLCSPRMTQLARWLHEDDSGSIIIFDMPPMLDADDLLAFSAHIDALLFIVAECETNSAELGLVQDLIEALQVAGVILNKSADKSPAYY
jgi:Mrp family chromosome partitioning ATPase